MGKGTLVALCFGSVLLGQAVTDVWAGVDPPLTTVRVASGLIRPVYVTAPDGDFSRIFVVEKRGRIRVITGIDTASPTLLGTPFIDIDFRVTGGTSDFSEQGLLGLAFHPDYLTNGRFFVNYTGSGGATKIAEYSVTNPATSNVANVNPEIIIRSISQPEGNHNGGCTRFGPDGMLYIGMGDGGGANDNHGAFGNAQDLNSLHGKMLRLDVDVAGQIPADNPDFSAKGGALPEIWSYGLRNPWRFTFDYSNGALYMGDVGQNAREEVNYVPGTSMGGENYGWRCMEGNVCLLGPAGPNCVCNGANLTDPIRVYVTSASQCSVIGGEVYNGCAIPNLQGTYFHGDFNCTGGLSPIWSFRVDAGGTLTNFVNRTTELDPPGAQNIRTVSSFGLDSFGEIYICDQVDGEVFKIIPAQTPPFTDCNSNGAEDACEVLSGAVPDDNGNGIPDSCECPGGPAPALLAEECTTCILPNSPELGINCENESTLIGSRCYAPKNRYLSIDVSDLVGVIGSANIRVKLVGSTLIRWVGPVDAGGISRLQTTPFNLDIDSIPQVIELADCEVVPAEQYDIQAIAASCDIGDEGLYSSSLILPTVTTWGDVHGAVAGGVSTPANGNANLTDANAIVKGFQDLGSAPNSWLDIHPQEPNDVVNLVDAQNSVKAFQGIPYPFSDPESCP